MNRFALGLLLMAYGSSAVAADSDVRMRSQYGSENTDLQSVLYFEDIGYEKLTFSGRSLDGKDYAITVKEFVNGAPTKTEVVFDSKEDAYFKIKGEELAFRVLSQVTGANTVRFEFQFNGFRKRVEYPIAAGQKDFAMKDFLGDQPELPIPLGTDTHVLTYMLPYAKDDGSTQYCEVVQSGVRPEELGKKYAIPRYFLIAIKFQ
ncbi:MAG TPA: hypothetical protein VJ806_07225 [Luteimonas sp.]|nr:hypothetical protein [Luteimonas sp.]